MFNCKEDYVQHSKSCHEQEYYPCEKCYFVFDSEDKFRTHLSGIEHNKVVKNEDLDSDEYDSDDEEFSDECNQCEAVFTS